MQTATAENTAPETLRSRFVVMDAAAAMPRNCWGRYRRVAVVEVAGDFEGTPKMISDRARGIVRIVESWEKLNVGTSERCAYRRALRDANDLAADLTARAAS